MRREKEKGKGTLKGGGKGERRKGKGQATGFFSGETITVDCAIYRLPLRSMCKGKGKGGGKGERKQEKKKGQGERKKGEQ